MTHKEYDIKCDSIIKYVKSKYVISETTTPVAIFDNGESVITCIIYYKPFHDFYYIHLTPYKNRFDIVQTDNVYQRETQTYVYSYTSVCLDEEEENYTLLQQAYDFTNMATIIDELFVF